jgi:hypothetical protein
MSALDRLPINQFDGASGAAAGGIVAPALNLAKPMAKTAAVPGHADLVAMAVQHGNVELLREAAAFAKDMHAIAARKAFDNAIADAKAEIPVIKKNRHVVFESKRAGAAATDYWHEDMGEIARTIDSILGKHGLSSCGQKTRTMDEPVGRSGIGKLTGRVSWDNGSQRSSTAFRSPDRRGGVRVQD